ncbi:HIT domain-containing protein [Dongia sp.]|uniref:HIT domain-containing protein n=1 Tax=Dongia sp. TaxID=1977262 RepID=UPI0035B2BE9C
MSKDTFALHPQLSADTFPVGDWPLCRVLRMNDRGFPWLILVPRVADIREIIELPEADQQRLMSEIARASRALSTLLRPDKLNVAALGNAVPQLHVHVIARFKTDPAWPRPIWGVKPAEPFDATAAELEMARLRTALAPFQ